MGLSVLSIPATTLLTTPERVKDELGIAAADTSADDVLLDILRRASSAIVRECGRTNFGIATYQETLKGTGSQLLGVLNVPILAVTQVLEDQEVLDPLDPHDGYSVEDAEAGALYRAAGWGQTAALLAWGGSASASRYILPGGSTTLRYTVTYTAGYLLPPQADYLPHDPTAGNGASERADPPPLPGAVEQACLLTVKAWWYSRQRDVAISRIHTVDQSVVYDPALSGRALPTVALGLLRDYRRVA